LFIPIEYYYALTQWLLPQTWHCSNLYVDCCCCSYRRCYSMICFWPFVAIVVVTIRRDGVLTFVSLTPVLGGLLLLNWHCYWYSLLLACVLTPNCCVLAWHYDGVIMCMRGVPMTLRIIDCVTGGSGGVAAPPPLSGVLMYGVVLCCVVGRALLFCWYCYWLLLFVYCWLKHWYSVGDQALLFVFVPLLLLVALNIPLTVLFWCLLTKWRVDWCFDDCGGLFSITMAVVLFDCTC